MGDLVGAKFSVYTSDCVDNSRLWSLLQRKLNDELKDLDFSEIRANKTQDNPVIQIDDFGYKQPWRLLERSNSFITFQQLLLHLFFLAIICYYYYLLLFSIRVSSVS